MDEDELSYKTLRKIQQMEKNNPGLTNLIPNFYNSLSEYLNKLDNRLNEEPSSQKKMILKDEINNTKKIVTNIYEHREKKILLAAVSKARGGNPGLKNLESVEKDLFDSVLNIMVQSRGQLLEQGSVKKNDKKETEPVEPVVNEKGNKDQGNSNSIMKITVHIPEFIGTDEKRYNLRKGDVVSLPENMGRMLSKRRVAEEIKQNY